MPSIVNSQSASQECDQTASLTAVCTPQREAVVVRRQCGTLRWVSWPERAHMVIKIRHDVNAGDSAVRKSPVKVLFSQNVLRFCC